MKEHKTFKPFEKVLVRNLCYDNDAWIVGLYSHYSVGDRLHYCVGLNSVVDSNILPYEGNEHLVGTTDEPQIPISEKEIQDSYWNNCTEEEKANLRRSYNEFLKDDVKGRSILEKVCGKHNLQDEQEEEVKLEEGERYFFCDDVNAESKMWIFDEFEELCEKGFYSIRAYWKYAIRLSDFDPNDMEETKKHILCVRNGKIIKYKG